MEKVIATDSPEDTHALGRQIAEQLHGGENVCLFGGLGSGKTVLVQGIAAGLGILESVKSPTFTYLREYEIPLRSTRLAHYDLYRLPEHPTYHDLDTIELFDRLNHDDIITVIEWSERLVDYLDHANLSVELGVAGDRQRRITLPKLLAQGVSG